MQKLFSCKRIIAALMLVFLAIPAFCDQNSKKVKNVIGRCEVTRHITLEQAEQKALQDAKTNALRKAGVPEKLWTVTGLISEDDGSEFSQVLSRMTTLSVDGFVSIEKVSYSTENVDGKYYAVATVDAEVKRGGSIDPTFAIDLNNVGAIYKAGEKFTFDIKIYGHDAYLKIFWFDDKGGSVIFPNSYERSRLFQKEVPYRFPTNNQIDYVMERHNPDKEFESINVIIVATKKKHTVHREEHFLRVLA